MSSNLKIHMTGNDGGVDVDGTLMLFSITNEEPAYTISKLELLIGSVRIVFNSPVVFPVNISLELVQGIVDSIGDYPISVRAYDSNNTIRMIDQSAMISVLDDSVQIVTPQELPVIVDITEATPQPDPEPEPQPEPEPEVESGDTYYDDESGYSYIYDGNEYIRIAYHDDAPKSHTHEGNQIISKVASATEADVANSVEWSNVQNPPATYTPSAHTHGNSDITDIDASKITSGTVNIARLPAGSLERLYPVATLSEMYQLTTDDVQNGDTVQVNNSIMYRVVDDTNLDNSSGYKEYTAGRATAVDWSGVENPPATYTPSAHTHTGNEITSAVEMANKLGSSTVGSSTNPIYLNNGVATACGFSIVKISSEPVNPDSNTIYIIVQ